MNYQSSTDPRKEKLDYIKIEHILLSSAFASFFFIKDGGRVKSTSPLYEKD